MTSRFGIEHNESCRFLRHEAPNMQRARPLLPPVTVGSYVSQAAQRKRVPRLPEIPSLWEDDPFPLLSPPRAPPKSSPLRMKWGLSFHKRTIA